MTILREAAQQALEALERIRHWSPLYRGSMGVINAIAALKAALAEQAQPVAWAEQIIEHLTALHNTEMIRELDSGDALIRLDDAIAAVDEARDRYTTPPAPDLLEALKRMASIIDKMGDMPDGFIHPSPWQTLKCEEALTQARAAIAKAEGEES